MRRLALLLGLCGCPFGGGDSESSVKDVAGDGSGDASLCQNWSLTPEVCRAEKWQQNGTCDCGCPFVDPECEPGQCEACLGEGEAEAEAEGEFTCGDGVCAVGESCSSCASDCGSCGPVCGDAVCSGGESCSSCPGDCGSCGPVCGDAVCSGGESCSSCPGDCGSCGPVCGDAACSGGETCSSCPGDCGSCGPVCGDAVCSGGESCSSCPADCGSCVSECDLPPWSSSSASIEAAVLAEINAVRAAGGVDCGVNGEFGPAPALAMNAALQSAARLHVMNMAENDFWSHQDPFTGTWPWDRASMCGYPEDTGIGENLGAGYVDAAAAVDGWVASDPHCAALMNPDYLYAGTGYYSLAGSDYTNYWAVVFGMP